MKITLMAATSTVGGSWSDQKTFSSVTSYYQLGALNQLVSRFERSADRPTREPDTGLGPAECFVSACDVATPSGRALAAVVVGVRHVIDESERFWSEARYSVEFWDIALRRRIGPSLPTLDGYAEIAVTASGGVAIAALCDDAMLRTRTITQDTWAPLGAINLRGEDRKGAAVAFGHWHSRLVLATCTQHLLEIRDPRGCKPMHTIDAGPCAGGTVAPADIDGRAVAVTNAERGAIRAWDLAAAQQFGHDFAGGGLFSPAFVVANVHGRPTLITSHSIERVIRMWDLRTQECVYELRLPERVVSHAVGDRVLVVGFGSGFATLEAPGITPLPPP